MEDRKEAKRWRTETNPQRPSCSSQCPEDFDWGWGWPGGPMICSATRSFMFWRMKASSRCGTSFQCVVSAALVRSCVASSLRCREAASVPAGSQVTAGDQWALHAVARCSAVRA